MNYAAMIDYKEGKEYHVVPFETMRHGFNVDFTSINLGGEGGLFMHITATNFW